MAASIASSERYSGMSPAPGIKVADLYGTGPAMLSDEPRYEWRPVSIAPNVTCVPGKAFQT